MAARSSGLQSGLGHPKRCADEKYTLTVGNGPSHRSGIRGLGTETSLLPGTQSALSGSSANAAASANSERRVIAIRVPNLEPAIRRGCDGRGTKQ